MSTEPAFHIYNAEALGQAIRHFRRGAGMTQADLAEQLGIQRSYLAELEAGEVSEQTQRIVKLLRALGARIVVERVKR